MGTLVVVGVVDVVVVVVVFFFEVWASSKPTGTPLVGNLHLPMSALSNWRGVFKFKILFKKDKMLICPWTLNIRLVNIT